MDAGRAARQAGKGEQRINNTTHTTTHNDIAIDRIDRDR
jgi:hypothetical protein